MALNDEQLRDRLTLLGCDVGPIDDTTRPLYVSLLKRRENDARKANPQLGKSQQRSSPSAGAAPPKKTKSRVSRPIVDESPGKFSDPDDDDVEPETPPKRISSSRKPTANRRHVDKSPTSVETDSSMAPSTADAWRSMDDSIGRRSTSRLTPPSAESSYVITPRNKYARRPLYAPNYSHSGASSNGFSDDENYYRVTPSTSRNNGSSHNKTPSSQTGAYKLYRDSSRNRHREVPGSPSPSHIISKVLFGVTALLFIALAFLYYRLGNQSDFLGPVEEPHDFNFEVCQQHHDNGNNCIAEHLIDKAWLAKTRIEETLSEMNYAKFCGFGDVTVDQDVCLGFSSIRGLCDDNEDVFKSALYLILANDQWGLKVNTAAIESCVSTDVWSPPLICRITRAIKQMVLQLLFLAAALIIAYFVYWLYERRKLKLRERKRLINGYVEDITDLLSNNAIDNPETPYLAILDIRNKLLQNAALDRGAQQLWKEVEMKFEATESTRVSREKQRIRGEWFVVWRWLPPPTSNGSNEKVWQGKAFDGHTGGKPITTCLKIKNMFCKAQENGENWANEVKMAILSKCGSSHRILHIYVVQDSLEGLVYAKMDSLDAAGDVHRKLHGSWFSGRLVTAKYLTEERYHQKFPDSVNCSSPISI